MSDERKEVLKLYEPLAKSYKLKGLDEYEKEFSFYLEKPVGNFMWELISVLMKRLSTFKAAVNIAFSPQGFVESCESKFFTKEDKEELYPVLQRLVSIEWESWLVYIKSDDEKAAFFKKLLTMWVELKPLINKLGTSMKEKWLETESKEKKHDTYLY